MQNYLQLPIGPRSPELVNTVVEIPMGSVNKYEYDKKLHVFRLDRRLYSPVHYPGDYGFIASTLAADGDPLDVLVLVHDPTFPGCLVEVRPIGVLEMTDQNKKDEKILAVLESNPRHAHFKDYTDVYPHLLREITHFFSIYKDLEGKRTKMIGWQSVGRAHEIINESHDRYLQTLRGRE
ncbi:MAG TPA: inorganic diphosphatase [Terriglobales bacterium]|nr:inorganic diphosphatase [Terriglobales bacterium]